jgi:hypothetical protein
LSEVVADRDAAVRQRDLARALALDDELCAGCGDGAGRRTCRECRSWCDHWHDPGTGARVVPGGLGGHSAYAIDLDRAMRAFTQAATATDWTTTPGYAETVVAVGSGRCTVRLAHDSGEAIFVDPHRRLPGYTAPTDHAAAIKRAYQQATRAPTQP